MKILNIDMRPSNKEAVGADIVAPSYLTDWAVGVAIEPPDWDSAVGLDFELGPFRRRQHFVGPCLKKEKEIVFLLINIFLEGIVFMVYLAFASFDVAYAVVVAVAGIVAVVVHWACHRLAVVAGKAAPHPAPSYCSW